MEGGGIAGLVIVWIGLLFGLAVIPARIAKEKGRDFLTWYAFGVVLFVPALIVALLMQNETPRPAAQMMRRCPHCAELILWQAKVCRYCRRDVAPLPEPIYQAPAAPKPRSGSKEPAKPDPAGLTPMQRQELLRQSRVLRCRSCGSSLKEGWKLCPNCGTPLPTR